MGILGRITDVLKQKANAVLDSAQDPAARVEALLRECQEHMKTATTELVGYKATEKRLAQRSTELAASALSWRQRAEAAVLAGDDALARTALVEENRVTLEHGLVEKERREMGAYAAQLLEARRGLQQRLRDLEIKRATIAQNLVSAKSGGSSVLSATGDAWDRLASAEARIDDQSALAEVDAMLGDPLAEGDAAVESRLRESMKQAQAEDALAALKKKMGGGA
jgi:phage shock protein A